MTKLLTFALVAGLASIRVASVQGQALKQPQTVTTANQDYVLGPDDQLKIWALGFEEELKDKTIRIQPSGFIDLPVVGRVKAAGLTTEQLEAALVERMKRTVRQPQVSVEIAE